jgi:hypothetical protein
MMAVAVAMAGLAMFTHINAGALAQRGLILFTSFLRGCVLHKKYQEPPPARDQARESATPPSYTKNLVKSTKT